jgi:hypothetical protein
VQCFFIAGAKTPFAAARGIHEDAVEQFRGAEFSGVEAFAGNIGAKESTDGFQFVEPATDGLNSDERSLIVHHRRDLGGFTARCGAQIKDPFAGARIKEAKRLLKQTKCPAYVVAQKVGFRNRDYFFKVFKRIEGTTPDRYRYAAREKRV